MNKKKNNKTAAVILASGTSERFNDVVPKQYKKVENKTILEITLKNLLRSNIISSLYVVYNIKHKEYIEKLEKKYKKVFFLEGADSRQSSCLNAINYLISKKEYKNVLIHDAVRPFISSLNIGTLIKKLQTSDGVIPALKIVESVKYAENSIVLKNIRRNNLYLAQTPQAFLLKKLKKAYDKVSTQQLEKFTDDSEIFTKAGYKVKIIEGCIENFKITTLYDFLRAKKMLKKKETILKVGLGIDFHRYTKGDFLILFGVKIPYKRSIKAHSDGDIGVHALMDAILGTISTGDIGTYFPNTDKKFKNISSLELLKKIISVLHENKGKIVHIDNTVICEKPKLQKYTLKMREKVAKILGIDLASFSIKATTTEKMGYIGKEEGIAVHTIATIEYAK